MTMLSATTTQAAPPARSPNLAAAPARSEPVQAAKSSGPVCVIDDDASVRDSLSVLLEALDFATSAYGSAAELLGNEQRAAAGCLIIDQHMPGMEGLDMLAVLRREGSTVPAILITGRLDPGTMGRAQALGVTGVLEKPFATERLIELVRRSLGQLQ